MNTQEFETILADTTKRIERNISWERDAYNSPAVEFRTGVTSETGDALTVKGRYNPSAGKLSYVLIHSSGGRIYGLDLGRDHRNPEGDLVGETHKHRWSQDSGDKKAYVPPDITESLDNPIGVWLQFCTEAGITHQGTMSYPDTQEGFAL